MVCRGSRGTRDTHPQQLHRVDENQHIGSEVDDRGLDRPDPTHQCGGNAQHMHHAHADEQVLLNRAVGAAGDGAGDNKTLDLSLSGGTVTLDPAGILTITRSGNTLTLTATEVDGSVTNEAWTVDADDADTEVISNQTVKFQGAGITTTDYNPATDVLLITSNEVDGSVTNEGILGVAAGISTTSVITSNTSSANGVTISVAGILTIGETTSTNGGSSEAIIELSV